MGIILPSIVLLNSLFSFLNISPSNTTNYFFQFMNSYECGFNSFGTSISNFSLSFLLLLVFFVVLDVEIVLLLNMGLSEISWGSLVYYLFFLVVVIFSFFYEIKYGFIKFVN